MQALLALLHAPVDQHNSAAVLADAQELLKDLPKSDPNRAPITLALKAAEQALRANQIGLVQDILRSMKTTLTA